MVKKKQYIFAIRHDKTRSVMSQTICPIGMYNSFSLLNTFAGEDILQVASKYISEKRLATLIFLHYLYRQ